MLSKCIFISLSKVWKHTLWILSSCVFFCPFEDNHSRFKQL